MEQEIVGKLTKQDVEEALKRLTSIAGIKGLYDLPIHDMAKFPDKVTDQEIASAADIAHKIQDIFDDIETTMQRIINYADTLPMGEGNNFFNRFANKNTKTDGEDGFKPSTSNADVMKTAYGTYDYVLIGSGFVGGVERGHEESVNVIGNMAELHKKVTHAFFDLNKANAIADVAGSYHHMGSALYVVKTLTNFIQASVSKNDDWANTYKALGKVFQETDPKLKDVKIEDARPNVLLSLSNVCISAIVLVKSMQGLGEVLVNDLDSIEKNVDDLELLKFHIKNVTDELAFTEEHITIVEAGLDQSLNKRFGLLEKGENIETRIEKLKAAMKDDKLGQEVKNFAEIRVEISKLQDALSPRQVGISSSSRDRVLSRINPGWQKIADNYKQQIRELNEESPIDLTKHKLDIRADLKAYYKQELEVCSSTLGSIKEQERVCVSGEENFRAKFEELHETKKELEGWLDSLQEDVATLTAQESAERGLNRYVEQRTLTAIN